MIYHSAGFSRTTKGYPYLYRPVLFSHNKELKSQATYNFLISKRKSATGTTAIHLWLAFFPSPGVPKFLHSHFINLILTALYCPAMKNNRGDKLTFQKHNCHLLEEKNVDCYQLRTFLLRVWKQTPAAKMMTAETRKKEAARHTPLDTGGVRCRSTYKQAKPLCILRGQLMMLQGHTVGALPEEKLRG